LEDIGTKHLRCSKCKQVYYCNQEVSTSCDHGHVFIAADKSLTSN
jgi:hypothetical protein